MWMNRMSKSQSISATSTTFDSFMHLDLRRSTSNLSGHQEQESLTLPFTNLRKLNRTISNGSDQSKINECQGLTPIETIVEGNLKVNNANYQNMLIIDKELEIKLVQEQQRGHKAQQIIRKKSAPNDCLRNRVRQCQCLLKKKKKFSLNYYKQIVQNLTIAADTRVVQPTNIQQKLDREYQYLGVKLNEQKNSLNQIIGEKVDTLHKLNQSIEKLKADIERIKEERSVRMKANSFIKKQNKSKREQFEQITTEYQRMQAQLSQLQAEQRQLESSNRAMKQLLQVEEQHTKTCMVLQRAIVLREQQKVRQEVYNRQTSKEYEASIIPQLKTMIKEKNKENDNLSRKLEEKLKIMVELIQRLKKKQESMPAESLNYRTTYTPSS